jgi:hypothetical protein
MAKAKQIKKLIHKPASFSSISQWLQQRDRPKGQPMADSVFWLAALTATYERVYRFDDEEDEDDFEDCGGNIAQYIDRDGKRAIVYEHVHLRRIWNALGEEKRPPKDMLKTLHETVTALSCYEGLQSEAIDEFLASRVDASARAAWARLMKEFLASINITGERLTGFVAAGSDRLEVITCYMHWSLAFAFKMFDQNRVERYAIILQEKEGAEQSVEPAQ